jgi:ubiquinol-cytochrome c reductase cytochrome b subunit
VRRLFESFTAWLDDRTGFRNASAHLLDEPLPAGTGWWFTLGSVLLFGLGVQFVTGIALALSYAPTPDHAWDSVQYIDSEVRGGRLVRGLHHWGSSVVVIAAALHLIRVVAFASYRKPRELNWIVGLMLLQVILAFGLTGYLLPWDQRAYWATVVSINISKLTPVAGEWIASLLQGGSEVGALTLTRWYAAHAIVLPVILVSLVAVHLYLLRRHGVSGPVDVQPGEPRPFFPYQAARDLTMAALVGVGLVALAWNGAPDLESPADPAASDYVPRPEWYFLGLFQLLKYFPGRLEVVGAIGVPGLVMALLALLPWLDRGRSREWRARRALLGGLTAGVAGALTLTVLGALDSPGGRSTAWNVRELAGVTLMSAGDRCTRCHAPAGLAGPIEPRRIGRAQDWLASHVADPEVIAAGVRPPPAADQHELTAILAALTRLRRDAPPAVDPSSQPILLTANRFCLNCHVIDGVGGREGPDLSRVGQKLDAATIERRIVNPKELQPNAEMPAFGGKIAPDDIRALAAWLARR